MADEKQVKIILSASDDTQFATNSVRQQFKKLVEESTSASLSITQSFKNLGIKSSLEFDLLRQKIMNSFEMIKNSNKATTNDIISAEKAKNAQIQALNAEQYGKQTSFIGNLRSYWLAAAAVIAMAMGTITRGWRMVEEAADWEEQKRGLESLAWQYGKTGDQVIKMVQKAVNGQLSMVQASDLASKGMLKGFNPDQIAAFTKYAERLTDTVGGKIPDAIEAMEKAAATGRSRGLVQYGIIIDLNKALEEYARKHDISKDAISAHTATQIRANAILEETRKVTARLGDDFLSMEDKINIIKATVADAEKDIGKRLLSFTSKTYDAAVQIKKAYDQASPYLKLFFGTPYKSEVEWDVKVIHPPKPQPSPENDEDYKQNIAAAQSKMQLRQDALKNEEKLEVASIDTRKALLEQEYQSAAVDTETYLNRKKELESEALRYSIANAAKEIAALKNGYAIIIANEGTKAEKTKAGGELNQKIADIKADIAVKEEKLTQLGIAGATELLKLKLDIAKTERDSRLKALEDEKELAEKRIKLEEESGTITSAEAVKQRYDWELKILELKRDNLQIDLLAEGDTRQRNKTYAEYLETLKKIKNLPERQRIDTGLSGIAAEKEAFSTMKDFASGYYLFQTEQINKLATKMRGANIAEVDIERWKTDQIKQYALQRYQFILEHTDSASEALSAKFSIMAINQKTEAQLFADGMGEIFDGGFKTINSVFFDALQGRMNSFKDYLQAFGKIVAKVMADITAEILKMEAMKLLGGGSSTNIFGSILSLAGIGGGTTASGGGIVADVASGVGETAVYTLHGGGIPGMDSLRLAYVPPAAFVHAPRYHEGFASGEYPAVLKKGEGVFTPGQMKALGMMAGAGAAAPEVKVDIANIISPDLLDAYLATGRGQNAVLNLISSKSGTIRRILSR